MTRQDAELEEALFYDSVARLYGWTPDQTDDVPADLLSRMMRVARIRSEVEEEQVRTAQAQAQAGGA